MLAIGLQVLALKLMMRWLLGLKSNENSSGTSTLRLFYTIIVHEGDLMERGQIKYVSHVVKSLKVNV